MRATTRSAAAFILLLLALLVIAHSSEAAPWTPAGRLGVSLPNFGYVDYKSEGDGWVNTPTIFRNMWLVVNGFYGRYCRNGECDFGTHVNSYFTNVNGEWTDDHYPISFVDEYRSACADIGVGGANVPAGRYVFTIDGNATFEFELDAVLVSETHPTPSSYRAVVDVTTPAEGFRVCATTLRAPLSNAKLVREVDANVTDAELAANPFHPDLLAHLAGATLLKFDGWMKVEDPSATAPRAWASRPVPGQSQVTTAGVAVEYMVQLCNELGAAPWFFLPAAGDGDFHTNMAALVLAELAPGVPVYFEYAHGVLFNQWNKHAAMEVQELWNAAFEAAGALSRLVHTHTSNYGDHITQHWGDDLSRVDYLAIPLSITGGFDKAAFVLDNPTLTTEDAIATLRMGVLEEEATMNALYHRLTAEGVGVMGYMASVVTAAPRYGFRDYLNSALRCMELRRYPCELRVWNDTSGEYGREVMYNETYPAPFSEAVLRAEAAGAPARLASELRTNWAARFVGTFRVPARDVHVFDVTVNYGMKLLIDGEEVMHVTADDPSTQEGPFSGRAVVTLSSGDHAFEVHYWDQWRAQYLDLTVRVGSLTAPPHPVNASLFTPDGITAYYYASFSGRYLDVYPPELATPDELLPSYSRPVPAVALTYSTQADPDVVAGAVEQYNATITAALDAGFFLADEWGMETYAGYEAQVAASVVAALDDPRMKDIHLEWWERLARIGIVDVVVGALHYPTGDHCALLNSCYSAGLLHYASQASSPKLDAFRARLAGTPSALPFTAADLPAFVPASCDPACVWGSCGPDGSCHCFDGYSGAACDVGGGPKDTDCSAHGININGIADWSPQLVYTDVWKASRGWISQVFDTHEWSVPANVTYDDVMYPVSLPPNVRVGSMMLRDLDAHGVSGNYTILYDGDGIVTPTMSDVVAVYRFVGRVVATVVLSTNGNNGLFLSIERTNPADPVRNIRVIMPGFEDTYAYDTHRFHPYFLESLRKYDTLRFMDWAHANGRQPSSWEHRATREWRSYAQDRADGTNPGVPIEDMVLLANMVGANPWFALPYNADEEYLTRFAELVNNTLRPDLDVYVEFANEAWHTGFEGGVYAQQRGLALGLNEEGNAWWGGAINEARLCYISHATKNISAIWKGVLGDARAHVVLSSQFSWDITSAKMLSCGNAHEAVDHLAVAPYFGFSWSAEDTLDDVMESIIPARLEEIRAEFVPHAAAAAAYNVTLLTYEAGSGGIGDGSSTDLAIQASLDPRMRQLYVEYCTMMSEAGVEKVMQFVDVSPYSRYGSWGLKLASDQDPAEAPKLLGYYDFLAATAPAGCTAPPAPTGCPGECSGRGQCLDDGTCFCWYRYSGESCADENLLHHYDCGYKCTFEQGTCELRDDLTDGFRRYHTCDCVEGFYGRHCALSTCPGNCSWNGECVDKDVCSCYRGYKGRACQTDCGCSGHGTCTPEDVLSAGTTTHTCLCDEGWVWDDTAEQCVMDCPCDECVAPGECACEQECVYGTCYAGECRCWAGATGTACDVLGGPAPNTGTGIGVGLSGPAYWSTQYAFVNVFEQASEWISNWDRQLVDDEDGRWGLGPETALDDAGWPTRIQPGQRLSKLLMRNVAYHAPAGEYVVLYDGDGTLNFGMDAAVKQRDKGRMVVHFHPSANIPCHETFEAYCGDNGMFLEVVKSNPANPIRNIRVLYPGFEATHTRFPFHPHFLKTLERFGTVRFMDWQHTNAATEVEWSDRPRLGHDNLGMGKGVPVERMVHLANVVGARPWFTVPHNATDAYVAAFAAYVRDNLRPDVDILVERSNEVWNPSFPAYDHALARARELGLDAGVTRDNQAVARYHSRRSVEVFRIFQAAFGASGSRVKHILSTWSHHCGGYCTEPYTTELLTFEDAHESVDAVGVTGYFCGQFGNSRKDLAWVMSAQELVAACGADVAATVAGLTWVKNYADSFGLNITTYEAGPSMSEYSAIDTGDFDVFVTRRLHEANRHPDLQQVYVEYVNAFRAAGVPSAGYDWMHFGSTGSYSQYGAWTFMEFSGQEASGAPKYRALMELAETSSSSSSSSWPTAAARGCLRADLNYLGVGDAFYVGAPAVTAPAAGDVWVQGREVVITHDVTGRSPDDPVVVRLFRGSNCEEAGGQLVATIRSGARATGEVVYRVPATTGTGTDFHVEIRDRRGANFSQPFTIKAPFFFREGPWRNCSESCGRGLSSREVTCHPDETALYTAAAEDAREAVEAVKITCPLAKGCNQVGRDARNQVCEPHEGVEWPITYIIDRAWESMCYYDEDGCRVYKTNFIGEEYGYSRGRRFTDCTVTWDDSPLIIQDDVETQAARRVPNRICAAFAPQPAVARQCFERPCAAYAFRASEWTACSATCGGGTRTRTVECINATLAVVDAGLCADVDVPATEQQCNTFPCDSYTWSAGDWSPCVSGLGCGAGRSRRLVSCTSSLGVAVADSNCDAATRPSSSATCDAGVCAAYAWSAGPFGRCSEVCGGGSVFRTVTCVDTASGDQVDEYFCRDLTPVPATSRSCNTRGCQTYGWSVGEWSACGDECGGTRTRDVSCVDSTGAVVPLSRCEGVVPSATGACPPCLTCTTATCSGHGTCDPADRSCTCTESYHGAFCDVPPSCPGVLDDGGACCASGVLDSSLMCCNGTAPALDRAGQCCPAGDVDACGVCGGTGIGLDVASVCCPAGGALDAAGYCCPSGEVDRCGVCDGDGLLCSTDVVAEAAGPTDPADLDPLSPAYLTFVNNLIDQFAALIGVDPVYLVITGVEPAAASPGVSRRLATDNSTLSITFQVDPAGNSSLTSDPLTADTVADLLADSNTSAVVSSAGVCGNGQCEVGEACVNGVTESCCLADCPTAILACPVSSLSSDMCSGSARGLCITSSGSCDCNAGYAGDACELCAAGWTASGATCIRAEEPALAVTPTPPGGGTPGGGGGGDGGSGGLDWSLTTIIAVAAGVGVGLGLIAGVAWWGFNRRRTTANSVKVMNPTALSPLASLPGGSPPRRSSSGSSGSRRVRPQPVHVRSRPLV